MRGMKRFQSFVLYGVFFVLYFLVFLYALIFKYTSPLELLDSNRVIIRSFNVIPFYTIYSFLTAPNVPPFIIVINILGNIILFVPLGIYLQLLLRNKKVWKSSLIIFLTTSIVELAQLIFGLGKFDIDDIILNCLGGLIGILVYRGLYAFLKNEEKVRTAIVLSGGIIILIPVLITVLFGYRFRLG